MLEALRGLGYTTATALADVIDNSISADARAIDVRFNWKGVASTIAIQDDGCGMSEIELENAMRLGARNPLQSRVAHDLGRFGLGLKTASFSQCRRLTVASKREGRLACFRWDLDVLASNGGEQWTLLQGPHPDAFPMLSWLDDQAHGTVVIWEVLDRVVPAHSTEQDLLDLIDGVEAHLAMVFHRFLEASSRFVLRLNGRKVEPWDPFLSAHPATWNSPEERVQFGDSTICVQAHVLPHQDRLEPSLYHAAAGPDGWTSQQGFYVYRNLRLLVGGGWLGLGKGRHWTKEEPFRLARIRLDIPNSTDGEWKIDVRKSMARPPLPLRSRLVRIAEDTRTRARRVFAHRGQPQSRQSGMGTSEPWITQHFAGGVRYRVDREHPLVKVALEDVGGALPQVEAMLRVIEETMPVRRIWLDTAEAKEAPRTEFSGTPPEEVARVMEVFFRNMVLRKGMSQDAARVRLMETEPFMRFPDLVESLSLFKDERAS